ncbi:hypothetical protein C2G38_1785321 [Gigaspora rosea]|uniref:Uncharacterized protein n=1 Tax=Gigaspora rosea TaxID=44941 RepID=A0A397USM4_9GLOM|nr:hypothetical protein C2G38_1785321 [Gigaspora rosea]
MINFTERTLISLIKIIQIFIQDFKNDSKLLQSRLSFFDTIIQMDYNELLLASSLMETMRYKKGPNEGKLLSKYLQHKAINFIENSFCQASHNIEECIAATKEYNKTIESLKYKLSIIKAENKSLHGRIGKFLQIRKQHISYIRSNARKSPTINKKELKSVIKQQLMKTKRQYTTETIEMATKVCQIGSMSFRSAVECTKAVVEWLIDEEPDQRFSRKTLIGWHKDVAAIYTINQCNIIEKGQFFAYGIMADESKRGNSKIFIICFSYWNSNTNCPCVTMLEMKDLSHCNGSTIASVVIETCINCKLDPKKCITWTTDNTAYMSGYKGGAIKLFNNRTQSESFRISCGMHSAHIMMTHFENTAFGKLNVDVGFSTQKHPFNLLYLIWHLHNGYDESKKENPMNMKASYISDMYKKLTGLQYTKFQKPLRQRWLYELHAARPKNILRNGNYYMISLRIPYLKFRLNV